MGLLMSTGQNNDHYWHFVCMFVIWFVSADVPMFHIWVWFTISSILCTCLEFERECTFIMPVTEVADAPDQISSLSPMISSLCTPHTHTHAHTRTCTHTHTVTHTHTHTYTYTESQLCTHSGDFTILDSVGCWTQSLSKNRPANYSSYEYDCISESDGF